VVVSGPVGTAGVAPAPPDMAGTSLADPRWPAQDPHWAHRRAPSLGPLMRTWKTSYHGRRDNSNLVAIRPYTVAGSDTCETHIDTAI